MARRLQSHKRKSYIVLIGSHLCEIAATWWLDFVGRGLLIQQSQRVAVPRAGVTAWIDDGKIRLLDARAESFFIHIRLNCHQIERMAIYDTRGPSLTPEQIRQEVERDYCLRV